MKKINGESGQTLILVAFGMTVLLGFAGLATDVGVMLHEKRQVQAAADSAALGAAAALLAGNSSTTDGQDAAVTAGQNDAANYGFTASEVTINVPPADDVNSAFNKTGYVEAIVTHKTNTFLMNLFGQSSETIKARAVATDQITGGGCFTALNPAGANPAVDLSGNSLVEATKCGANIDGNLTMQGSSEIQIGNLAVSGNINYIGNGSSISGNYSSGAPTVSDPMAQFSQPDNEPTISGSSCTPPTGSGFTASQCFVNAPLKAGMASGMYVFTQQPTFSSNNLSVTGNGPIVIYLSGSFPFAFNKNLTATLNSPSSGTLSGILIDAPTDVATNNDCTKGNGKNASTKWHSFL